ncbi:hypothetical protein M9Y10_003555 [Tritrichomonas musculus]|uniref:Uncharacterized protein n=1 Tax=Tritrichomonas musculus TaxID=1915356 RepID=A0ABR2JQ64_9EUKA
MSIVQKIEYNISNIPQPGQYYVAHKEYDGNLLSQISLQKAVAKIILMGDPNVGKTCLVAGIVSGEFRENYQPTVGVQFINCNMFINGTKLTCQIWDLAGQEAYSTVSLHYCRGADIVLFCFSLADKTSFQRINNWKAKLLDSTSNYAAFFLVGCKSDLPSVIRDEEIKAYCEENQMEYFKTSAKTKMNTKQLMERVGLYAAFHVHHKKESITTPKISIDPQPDENVKTEKGKKKGCC